MGPISIKPSHRGLLHKALGLPMDQPISLADLVKTKMRAKKTGNVSLEKQAVFAQNARKW